MATGHIKLNGEVGYVLAPVEIDGETRLVHRRTIEALVDKFALDGQQRQEQIREYSTKTLSSLRRGFGRDVIRSQVADDPREYQRFFDSTCETRFDEIRLAILAEDSTHTGLEVLRVSASFKGDLWGLWEDDTGTDIVARKYTGSTTTWEGGGNVKALGAAVVALDIIAHKTHLIALLYGGGNDHNVYRSTDGATWTAASTQPPINLLTNVPGVHEDIDAGLLADIGGEAVAALWHEVTGNITFASSTNVGDTWTDEAVDIASGNGPQGIAVYPGLNNSDMLYVGTREGLWEVDTSPATWTFRHVFPMTPHNDNCRRMTVHNGRLWFSVGVDNSTPFGMWAMEVNGDTRRFTSIGLDHTADAIPTDMLGPVRFMKSAGKFLYVSMGGGAASRNGRILCAIELEDGTVGWHHMYQNSTANEKIEWIDVSADDDGVERLHLALRTTTATSDAQFLGYPSLNPATNATVKRNLLGLVDLPEIDGGMPNIAAAFLRVAIHALSTTSGTGSDDEFINVDYGIDGVSRASLTNLGDITSGTTSLQFASGAGVSGNSAMLRLNLDRGTSTATATPRVRATELRYLKQPSSRDEFRMRVDIVETSRLTDISPETVITNLETARDLATLPTFQYANLTQTYVKVKPIDWIENLVDAGGAVAAASTAEAMRIGFADLTLREID